MIKFLSITILIASVILNSSCQSKSNKNSPAPVIKDSAVPANTKEQHVKDTLPEPVNKLNLATVKNIGVLSLHKEIKSDSTDEDYAKCRAWSLTARQVEFLIRKFKSMTSEEQYLSYSVYNCSISGEIKIDQVQYKYWMGSGGTLVLKSNGISWYFGYPDEKESNKYFISGRLTDKELKQ